MSAASLATAELLEKHREAEGQAVACLYAALVRYQRLEPKTAV